MVFIAGAAFAAVCGFSLLGPGRFLDRLWSVKAGSEHQFRTMGWSGPLFLLALAIALIAAGIGLSRRRGWARWATIALLMANLVADIPDFIHGDLAVLPFVVLIAALSLPSDRPRLLLEMGSRPADGRRLMIADHQINLTGARTACQIRIG